MRALLDDVDRMQWIDRDGMCDILLALPEDCERAVELATALRIPRRVRLSAQHVLRYTAPDQIVIAGMGGSAMGGSLFKDWLRATLPMPVEICRGYTLPAYADAQTLVVATSYSGNTEETLSCWLEAVERGCMVLGITSNGVLQEFSERLGLPLVTVPEGYPPRSALPYLFFPLIAAMRVLDVLPAMDAEIAEAIAVLKAVRAEIRPEQPTAENLAKQIAVSVQGSIPLIAGFGVFASVARRMKTQFNENSKTSAVVELFPELRHNAVVGWAGRRSQLKEFGVLLLRDGTEPPEIRKMIEVTRDQILGDGAAAVVEIWSRGEGPLARMLSTLYVGDFASVYLGILNGVDPTPTENIDEVKKYLVTSDTVEAMQRRFARLLDR